MAGFLEKCFLPILALALFTTLSYNRQPVMRSTLPFILVRVGFSSARVTLENETSSIYEAMENFTEDFNWRMDSTETVNTSTYECSVSTPCGFAVYSQYNRILQCFQPSPCVCPENTTCVRDYDDLQFYSYVHKCHSVDETDRISDTDLRSC